MSNNTENISLTELQMVIRDKLYEAFPGSYSVIAEIAEMKVNSSGHCYLELTDSSEGGNKVTARARATIWAGKFRIINALFESMAGLSLQAGLRILFRATVEYHELYGLSLNITDIDPRYTVGETAVRRDAIIRRLATEGVLEMNQEHLLSPYPRKIAVISSSSAAGYQDFIRHLSSNAHGFVFVTSLFDTVMQGNETEQSVLSSLNNVASVADDFDAVAIIRGGGSQTDLGWFDNYNIAYLVTQFPLPVITGIGHDKDLTVTDIVAWKALKTPTAVADFFISHTLDTETEINEMALRLSRETREMLNDTAERLSLLRHTMASSAGNALRQRADHTLYLKDSLARAAHTTLRFAGERLGNMGREVNHLDPLNVLRRGYTITSLNGLIVRDHRQLHPGDKIVTHFTAGTAESEVQNVKYKKNSDEKKGKKL